MEDQRFKNLATLIRKWSLIATTEAGSGHPTSCLSAADLTAVLFDKYFHYDLKNPQSMTNDRFVLSKGHAAPLLYTLFALKDAFPLEDLKTLRKFTSILEGHPTFRFPYAEAATGSLGQGLSIAAGLSYVAKNERLPFKTYVLLGDGEMSEGQVWEAANFASYYKLHNLIALVDINRLAQSGETMFGQRMEEYINRFEAFGFETLAIDGHNFFEIDKALQLATNERSEKPFVILAKTFKGKGVSFLENKEGWHGKALTKEELTKALSELGEVDDSLRFSQHERDSGTAVGNTDTGFRNPSLASRPSQYKIGEEIATREAYGKELIFLGAKNPLVYVLDADVKNSTFSQDFLRACPERFVECFIAEQNMVSVAVGLARMQKIPFIATFGAFLTRAHDQIRMAAIAKANLKFCGSHAGVAIGEDGPSQMALEDLSLFGALPDSVVVHPADAVSTAKIMPALLEHNGISYLRTLRSKTPVLYDQSEEFRLGGAKILRQSPQDLLTVACCGITVHEALKAYETLAEENIFIRVMDCYSIKPLDKDTLFASLKATKQKIIITMEDHYIHGGLGDFVLEAVSGAGIVKKMAVEKISRSGTMSELLADAGIDAKHLAFLVRELNNEEN